jgi:hypothetical protein
MTEGGVYPWKRQIIRSAGPTADYSTILAPLPKPEHGLEWRKVGHEWQLVEKEEETADPDLDAGVNTHESTKQTAIENVDYVIHTILPSDTLAGLCLRYKVSATKLRQINKFSGSNLLLAPSNLIVPIDGKDVGAIQVQDKTKPEYKLQAFLASCPHLRLFERRAYLEMNDWNLDNAIAHAKSDDRWEKQQALKLQTATPATTTTRRLIDIHVGIPVADSVTRQIVPTEGHENELLERLLLEPSELEMARRSH